MSRRRSASVLDIPGTPLLEPAPGHESPFGQEDEGTEEPPPTPGHLQEIQGRKKKKGVACAGIAVLGLVIVGALILVAVKQSQPRDAAETDLQRSFTTTAAPLTTAKPPTSTSKTTLPPSTTQPTSDKFQSKLVTLYQLVSECKGKVGDDPEFDCEVFLGLATPENIDKLIKELTAKIQDSKFGEDLGSLSGLQEIIDKLKTTTSVDHTSYQGIVAGLEPVLQESHQHPVNQSTPGRREDSLQHERPSTLQYQPAEEVFCDGTREFRCRDKTACYPKEKHCDFSVDCEDNSDEDSCSCVQRLIDDRLCDAITDCVGADDEADCGCGEGEFFCAPHPAWGPPECIKKEQVCDGHEECSNGRDEDDCYVLGKELDKIVPGTAASMGYLALWRWNVSSYLPIAVPEDLTGIEDVLMTSSVEACAGVVGSVPSYTVVTVPDSYRGKVAVLDVEQGVVEVDRVEHNMALVHCGEKHCGQSSARYRREIGRRVKRDNTFDPECYEKLAEMNETEQENFKNSPEYTEECSLGNTTAKIVGGEVSYPDSWPYTVALYREGLFICGATIVSPEWIITAGHCVFGYKEGQGFFYNIRAGMIRRQSQAPWEQVRHLVEVFIHPEYDNTYLRHDIALGKLDTPLTINRHVQSICLPYDADMYPSPGSTCMATGWGDLSEDGPSSEELREVEVPILAKCGRSYNNISYQICGGYTQGGKDACQGDSGGPLYCYDKEDNWYLGGVISHGRGCARAEEAGVYVRLAYYMDWVRPLLDGVEAAVGQPKLVCSGLTCGSGECIPNKWVCDQTVDCLDGGDTKGCVTLANGTRVQIVEEETTTTETVIVENAPSIFTEEKTPSSGDMMSKLPLSGAFVYSTVSCEDYEFKCSSLEQCVPADARCDGMRDCPDWSDEMDCVCGEKIDVAMVCDGVYDCRDQSDEVACELCDEDEWRCPLSGECVQGGAKCDTHVDCKWGEDERYCTAFTDDNYLPVSPTGDIIPLSQGMLLINQEQQWKPVCAVGFSNGLANNICQYMGWPEGIKYGLVPQEDSPLNGTVMTQIVVEGRSSESCFHVNIECEDENCGARPMYRNLPSTTLAPLSGPGSWPWHANFFNEGEYVCGGTIVNKMFVLTDLACAKQVVQSGNFITVLVGQERRRYIGLAPSSQVRRVISLKVVQDSTVVLAQLDEKLDFNDYVNQLCLSKENWTPSDSCVLSGMSGDWWTKTVETSVSKCSSSQLCLTTSPTPDVSTINWAGALACADTTGRYYAVGVYHSDTSSLPDRVTSLLSTVLGSNIAKVIAAGEASDPSNPEDTCEGFRCKLGRCIKEEDVCDKNWDCREGEDELDCPEVVSTSLALCELAGSGPHCTCPAGQLKCGNNLCLARDQWCNGVSECGDGTDEPAECGSCVGKLALLSPQAVCDSVPDCEDYSDETGLACGCDENSFRCDQPLNMSSSFSCIPASALCDGTPDCPGGIDEDPTQCIALSPLETVQQNLLLSAASSSVGYVKVRTYGMWYTYCASAWSDSASTAICTTLGNSGMVAWSQFGGQKVQELGDRQDISSDCTTIFLTCS